MEVTLNTSMRTHQPSPLTHSKRTKQPWKMKESTRRSEARPREDPRIRGPTSPGLGRISTHKMAETSCQWVESILSSLPYTKINRITWECRIALIPKSYSIICQTNPSQLKALVAQFSHFLWTHKKTRFSSRYHKFKITSRIWIWTLMFSTRKMLIAWCRLLPWELIVQNKTWPTRKIRLTSHVKILRISHSNWLNRSCERLNSTERRD